MRTLQEKYNGIQEGKFSKDHFLADARMELPNLVTRFNGYDDAVQILKNRGMIKEAKVEEATPKTMQAGFDMVSTEGKKHREIIRVANKLFPEFGGDLQNLKPLSSEQREMVYQNLDPANIKEAKLTKKSLTDYRYKPTNEMDKYPYEQILRGLRVELEGLGVQGTPTAEQYAKALATVSKNLAKDSIFYTNQVAGVNPKVDLHDKMVPVTAKNTVDTFNGMKKAELKEGFKKLIKKVLSESMGDMFGDEERAERSANYGQPGKNEYEFYSDPENYKDAEEEFELQEGEKSDLEYKSELSDYLDDNGIYGYADMIHDIMTGPDEEEASADLKDFLDDHQIYGYNKGIEQVYANYPYDQHWKNQPDEDQIDESSMGDIYLLAQESDTLKDFLIRVKQAHPETDIRTDIEELQYIWNNRNPDEDESVYEGKKSLSQLLK
ncbi:hypothetical protein UFOVP54_44 [uncultured Caudovirales phage]|uniref:Uncharacterized protein n=1 Tax=uncultured Caudovirales phage TaxID=2100421 RepID=A0A6J5KVN7_9CAUD|nr:hypothetical protein UFOVP54_44 [uncultured Caudovirales phage]